MDFQSTNPNSIASNEIYSPETYEDYLDPRFPSFITVLVLIIGLFGNFLSILVFSQKSMKKNSTFIYLGFLCYIDIFVLIFGLGDIVLITYFNFVLRNQLIITCRIHTFLTYSFTHLSSFILASVSVDRAIATNFISFAKYYCTQKTAHRIIFLLCLLSAIINLHSLIFLGYDEPQDNALNSTNDTTYYCASLSGTLYDNFMNPYFQWIDLIFYAILPFIVMFLSSIFIIRVIFISNKRLENKLTGNSIAFLNKTLDPEAEGDNTRRKSSVLSVALRKSFVCNNPNGANRKYNNRLNKTLHLTYTLITINTLFICLVGPLTIALIIIKKKEKIVENKIIFNIVYSMAYSNHSLNFIFYGLMSPPYRNAVKNLFFKKCSNSNKQNEFNIARRESIRN